METAASSQSQRAPRTFRRGTVSLSVIFVVLVAVFALGGYFLGSSQTKRQAAQQVSQKPVLPVALSDKSIKYAVLNYAFSGKVLGVKTIAQGIELTTDVKGAGIPKFVVTPKTKVYNLNNGVQTAATVSAIAVNQTVEISVPYGLKQKAWRSVSSVRIGVPATKSPMPAKSGN